MGTCWVVFEAFNWLRPNFSYFQKSIQFCLNSPINGYSSERISIFKKFNSIADEIDCDFTLMVWKCSTPAPPGITTQELRAPCRTWFWWKKETKLHEQDLSIRETDILEIGRGPRHLLARFFRGGRWRHSEPIRNVLCVRLTLCEWLVISYADVTLSQSGTSNVWGLPFASG